MEIKVENKGKSWGTAGWLAKAIDHIEINEQSAELVLNDGSPPIFLGGYYNDCNPYIDNESDWLYLLQGTEPALRYNTTPACLESLTAIARATWGRIAELQEQEKSVEFELIVKEVVNA